MRQGRHADIPNPQHLQDFAELVRMTIDFDLPISFERSDTTVSGTLTLQIGVDLAETGYAEAERLIRMAMRNALIACIKPRLEVGV